MEIIIVINNDMALKWKWA